MAAWGLDRVETLKLPSLASLQIRHQNSITQLTKPFGLRGRVTGQKRTHVIHKPSAAGGDEEKEESRQCREIDEEVNSPADSSYSVQDVMHLKHTLQPN